MIGGYFIGIIPEKIIVGIFFLSGFMYLYKYFTKGAAPEKHNHYSLFISGFITAFLQAFGMQVGAIRQGYLFSRGHSLQVVQGTIAVVFLASGVATLSARLLNESIPLRDTLSILVLFPFMLLTMHLAKKIVYKMPKKLQDGIILYSLIFSLLFAVPYLFV